jgi:hypothetical protein
MVRTKALGFASYSERSACECASLSSAGRLISQQGARERAALRAAPAASPAAG